VEAGASLDTSQMWSVQLVCYNINSLNGHTTTYKYGEIQNPDTAVIPRGTSNLLSTPPAQSQVATPKDNPRELSRDFTAAIPYFYPQIY